MPGRPAPIDHEWAGDVPLNRRARRRQETIDEILKLAVDIMAEDGVAGLTVAEIARRLGVRPSSIYKYFPSLTSIYDALFRRASIDARDAGRAAMDAAEPGMAAVVAAAEAAGRWAVANPVLAQLVLWRPVPQFRPSAEAFAPSQEIYELMRRTLASAVDTGELSPEAATAEGTDMLASLIA